MDRSVIFTAFADALGQMSDPRFRAVLLKGVGLTVLLLFAIYALVYFFVLWLLPETITLPWVGQVGLAESLIPWGSVILMMVLSVFLMVPVASAVTGMFLESVAQAVEDKHYPHLPDVAPQPIGDVIRDSLGFFGLMVAVNLVGLVVYLLSGPLAPFVFWAVNGFLLGREYFQMVAMRRLGRKGATELRRAYPLRIWLAGMLMAVPLSIPLVNLLIPIIGAATFTHQFHRLNARSARV